VEGPILDKRLAVAESYLRLIRFAAKLMKNFILSFLIMLPLRLAAAPVSIALAELLRDHQYVTAREVGTNAVVIVCFRTWPDSPRESEFIAALRSHLQVEVTEATNTLARGALVGHAFREDREGHNLFGLMLRVESLKAAERAVSQIKYDPDTQLDRNIEQMRRNLEYKRRWS
jgi:hypothetical protein